MKIPRRLKEIIFRHGDGLIVEQEKRGYALVGRNGGRMIVNIGQVVTLEQWDRLSREIGEFCAAAAQRNQ